MAYKKYSYLAKGFGLMLRAQYMMCGLRVLELCAIYPVNFDVIDPHRFAIMKKRSIPKLFR